MKKQEYLDALKTALTKLKVTEIEDIVAEYAEHFDFKIADGFTEEEIAAKLGTPNIVAGQYAQSTERARAANAPLVYCGLVTADVFGAGPFFALFAAWVAVLGGAAISFLGAAVALIFNINIANIMPSMPYLNGLLLALPCLFLCLMSAVGTIYCALYLKQLFKAYVRWHRNAAAASAGKPILPSLAKHPQLKPKTKRTLRNLLMISIIGFGITFIIAYTAAAISANAFEFWHAWKWFQ